MEGLTVHALVRDEPFIWYSVRSVLPFVDRVMLWDTGSEDYTIDDIHDLLKADEEGKISFRHVEMETDERYWTSSNWKQQQRRNAGKRGVGVLRQEMIDETETDFFMILDGDEVWYPGGMKRVCEFVEQARANPQVICGRVPLRWFCDMNVWFRLSYSGRIFKTDRVVMHTDSPGEMHMDKNNRTLNSLENGHATVTLSRIMPYAHYETLLKPWRRSVAANERQSIRSREWPSVFTENSDYLNRFLRERRGSRPKRERSKRVRAEGVKMFRPETTPDVIKFLSQFASVLDLGCGHGNIIAAIKSKMKVGIDISPIPLKKARALKSKSGARFRQLDVREALRHFGKNSFEATVGFDILEHIPKEEGWQLLDDAQQLATKVNVWFLPAGWMDVPIVEDNVHMLHKAAWEPEDLAGRGYEVWHYLDWFKARLEQYPDTTTLRGMFAIRLHDRSHNVGIIHTMKRHPKPHVVANDKAI